ncbi:immunity 26/phosphotriesterase HocA family protein [Streptomyces actinomycinicus]|uniref:Immunity 26/phosphotriesterase HocA family protein n=1 Tax=Streptomyces actinomycinicus TaxID=1695166 RepID=A0A937EFZ4_9ACTN|nr:immunity 26/phosphotriesterase HocA family protein [Streptomyces actinomycinicus]MBL1082071.1 immunity 26/phosphotriesterase HocA family protein [Streptomyces actinomycinicus]
MQQPAAGPRKVTKARASRAPGRVARIDLGDGRCAFGRQLTGLCVEFYDLVGRPGAPVDLIEIVAAPVAFKIWVMDSAFRRRSGWELLDVVPLTREEQAVVHVFSKQDPLSGSVTVHRVDPVTRAGRETPSTLEEGRKLERAAVWAPEHIEDRLRDHFDGRPNKWVESLRLKP